MPGRKFCLEPSRLTAVLLIVSLRCAGLLFGWKKAMIEDASIFLRQFDVLAL